MNLDDDVIIDIFLKPVSTCKGYLPAFGQGGSVGLGYNEFEALYSSDPFYNWLGLTDRSVYSAHKAAGGLTSVYRQIGIGAERMLQHILRERLRLSEEDIQWSYEYSKPNGKAGVHYLDARIPLDSLSNKPRSRFQGWLDECKNTEGNQCDLELNGAVFEIRQGYKSADSKRQNADLRFGMRAYKAGMLPVVCIVSQQVSVPVIRRYRQDGMIVLTGELSENTTKSTFAFFNQVIGYDLANFFERNSDRLRSEITAVTEELLMAR